MVIDELSTLDEISALEPVWNDLVAQSPTDTIFLSYEWITAYLSWIARDCTPLVLVAREGRDIVGIAPLMVSRRSEAGVTVRRVEFIGVPNSDYSDFIWAGDHGDVVRALLRHIAGGWRWWDEILLTEIPGQSPTVDVARSVFAKPWSP